MAENDDDPGGGLHSRVSFSATPGQVYRIAADGFSGATGTADLNWSMSSTAPGTVLNATSGEPTSTVTVSATGAPTPFTDYVVEFSNTASSCPGSSVTIGGSTTSDGSGNIPPTQAVIPGSAQSGTKWICFARTTNPSQSTPATSFVVI